MRGLFGLYFFKNYITVIFFKMCDMSDKKLY